MASVSNINNTLASNFPSETHLSLPAADLRDTLPLLLRSAFAPPFSHLRQALSRTQQHVMQSFYVPPIPDTSDRRHMTFQHRSNATSILMKAVEGQGVSRSDVRLALEQIRYIPFLNEVHAWIQSGSQAMLGRKPEPLPFDVRNRTLARDAFKLLAHELRIPHHLCDHGEIEPIYVAKLGFAIRIHAHGEQWTFLMALSNGSLLKPPSGDSQKVSRELSSPNRQLFNILGLQAPAYLEKALEPRPIIDVGAKRIALFPRKEHSTFKNYFYLPPSVTESHLVPLLDSEALVAGQKSFFLIGADSKKHIATVTIPSRVTPVPTLSLAKEVLPSPFKRFKPFAAYLRGRSSSPPEPLEVEIYRSQKTAAHTQQRILLGKQMSVPAWYPLRTMTVHPAVAADGTRYLGLYAPGISPSTNPPLKAFTLGEGRGVHLKSVEVDAVWCGLQQRADELRALVKSVVSSNSERSRDAWVAIQELAAADPILVSTLLLANMSRFSIHNDESLRQIERLLGWDGFKSSVEGRLLESQARSVPYVAHLLVKAQEIETPPVMRLISRLTDVSYAMPSHAITHLTRLAAAAPEALERSCNYLRDSQVTALVELVGNGPVHELLRTLTQREKERSKERL